MGRIGHKDIADAEFPASQSGVRTVIKNADGILECFGTAVPADGTAGFVPGCKFINTGGSAGNVLYVNDGSASSCNFNSIKTLSNAFGTAAGKGPSPIIWQEVPLLDIMLNPELGFVYFDDFLGPIDVTSGDGWTLTQVDTKGSILGDVAEQGGVLTVTSATGDSPDDGIQGQLKNCMFKPASGTKIYFEARVKMGDATQQYFIGLAGVDTTLMASGVMDDVVDKCGFYHEAASTDNKISAISSRLTSEEKDTDVATNTDGVYMKVGFVIDGLTRVDYYVNGVNVGNCVDTSDIPNAVMCLSAVAQYESADDIMDIDWVRIAQYKAGGAGRS